MARNQQIEISWLENIGYYRHSDGIYTHPDFGFFITKVTRGWCVFADVHDLATFTTRPQLLRLMAALKPM